MTQQHSHVPKFGNWESEGNVPYTVYFEKARKGRHGTKTINPNDPEENPDILSNASSSNGSPAVRTEPVDERRDSKEDSRPRHSSDHGSYQDGSGETNTRAGVSRSSIHRQEKVSERESSSLEGKGSYDSSHGTPGRSIMKAERRDETVDMGTAVPKFGEWDERNPSSAEGYTGIFDKVREERQMGVGQIPSTPPPAYNIKKQETGHNAKCCCFMWSK